MPDRLNLVVEPPRYRRSDVFRPIPQTRSQSIRSGAIAHGVRVASVRFMRVIGVLLLALLVAAAVVFLVNTPWLVAAVAGVGVVSWALSRR